MTMYSIFGLLSASMPMSGVEPQRQQPLAQTRYAQGLAVGQSFDQIEATILHVLPALKEIAAGPCVQNTHQQR